MVFAFLCLDHVPILSDVVAVHSVIDSFQDPSVS